MTIAFIGSFPEQYIRSALPRHRIQCIPVAMAKSGDSAFFHAIADAEIIVSRSGCLYSEATLSQAHGLQLLIKAGAGTDMIDHAYCKKRGILVKNTPGANAQSVAELAVGLLIALVRHIPLVHNGMTQHQWMKEHPRGEEIAGKHAAIIGYGYVGRRTAAFLASFGCSITLFDPTLKEEERDSATILGHRIVTTLVEAVQAADYIILHASMSKNSKQMINASVLGRVKRGVKIINLARGDLMERDAVLAALEDGTIGGLAIDTWWKEPAVEAAFAAFPQVIMTPHIGANTAEALERTTHDAIAIIQEHITSPCYAPA